MPLEGGGQRGQQQILNLVAEEHGTSARGNPYLLMQGGKYVATATALSDGDSGVQALSAYGEHMPMGIGGQSTFFTGTGTNTDAAIKTSAGFVYLLDASNPTTADAYLQVFDLTTANTTLNVTTPKFSFLIPAGASGKSGAMDKYFNPPIKFGNAITYAVTGGASTSGTITGTGKAIVNVSYT